MEFLWLNENPELKECIIKCKDDIFSEDSMSCCEYDMFDNIVAGKKLYNGKQYYYMKEAVIVEESSIVGIIGYYSLDEENIWINWYGILHRHRRKGYGSKAIKKLTLELKSKENAKYLRLYTGKYENAEAYALYKKLGFLEEQNMYSKEGENDLIIMGRAISDKDEYKQWNDTPVW